MRTRKVPDQTLDAFLALLNQVGHLYRSSCESERQVSPADWVAFQQAVEAFDQAADGIVLGKSGALPILCKPATVIQGLIDPTASNDHNRLFHLLTKYEFVFQLVRGKPLPGVGLKLGRVLDGVLDGVGLSRGMDLSAHQRELNALTQPEYHVLRESRMLTDDDADFYFDVSERPVYAHVSVKFDDRDAVVARFERQSWWTPLLDIEVASDLRWDVHDDVTRQLAHAYRTEPKRLMQRPVR